MFLLSSVPRRIANGWDNKKLRPLFLLVLSFGCLLAAPVVRADTLTITPDHVMLDDSHPTQMFTATYSIPNQESGEPELLDVSIDGQSVSGTKTQSGLTVTVTFTVSRDDFPCGLHTITAVGRKDEDDPVQDSQYDYPETMTATQQFTSKKSLSITSQTANPNPATTCDTVNFSASATGGCPPLTYTWDFGDNTTGTGASTTHKYAKASPDVGYTVTVTVTDSNNTTATQTLQEVVKGCYTLTPLSVDDHGNVMSGPATLTTTSTPKIKSNFDFKLIPNGSVDTTDGQFTISGTVNSIDCDVTDAAVIDHLDVYLDDADQPFTTVPISVSKQSTQGLNQFSSYVGTFPTAGGPGSSASPIVLRSLIPGNHYLRFEASELISSGVGESIYEVQILPTDAGLEVSHVLQIVKTDTDDGHPTVLRVDGDKDTLSDPAFRVTVYSASGGSEDRQVVRWLDPGSTDPDGKSFFVANSTGQQPEVTLLSPISADDPDAQADSQAGVNALLRSRASSGASLSPRELRAMGQLADSGNFLLGFGEGFLAGGIDLVKSTGGAAIHIAKFGVSFPFRLAGAAYTVTGRILSGKYKRDIQNVRAEFAQFKGAAQTTFKFYSAIQKEQTNIYLDLITGRYKELKKDSQLEQLIFKKGADVFSQAIIRWSNLPPKQAGQQFGRLIFDIASLFVPGPKATPILRAVSTLKRSEFLRALIPVLRRDKILAAQLDFAKLDRAIVVCQKSEGATICFVAGTPVLTSTGRQPIETIHPGDSVLARDPQTGYQTYKPVQATIVTHPHVLYHVRYQLLRPRARGYNSLRSSSQYAAGNSGDSDASDDDGDDELVCTGAHPFYIVNQGTFVEADKLIGGDIFLLASGEEAQVSTLKVQEAASGQTFTTYNLDVSEFHTYFVGKQDVWVHNVNILTCDDLYREIQLAAVKLQDEQRTLDAAYKLTDPWDILNYTIAEQLDHRPVFVPESIWSNIYKKWMGDLGYGANKLYSPPTIVYNVGPNSWLKSAKYAALRRRRTAVATLGSSVQGNHWWPQEFHAAGDNGQVFSLATPFLHTAGPEGFHYKFTRFLEHELSMPGAGKTAVTNTFLNGLKDASGHLLVDTPTSGALFTRQKALLSKFWAENYYLKMPDFPYKWTATGHGRGVLP